jgi:hypothetical protein
MAEYSTRCFLMLKESLKAPLFTDGFRLSDLLCQSYLLHVSVLPPTCVVLSSPVTSPNGSGRKKN